MELMQLKYFQVTAKCEHITRAAEELHIAQPSLSLSISNLEHELGIQLFDRLGRNIRLNKYGEIFLNRVDQMFSELEDGTRELRDFLQNESLNVSLGLNQISLCRPLFKKFLNSHPDIQLRQEMGTIAEMQNRLYDGSLDLCISAPPLTGPNIECTPLIEGEIFLLVPKSNRFAQRKSIKLNEAENESFVSLKSGFGTSTMTDDLCRKAGFIPKIVFEGDVALEVYELVKEGLGVALLPVPDWIGYPLDSVVSLHIEEPDCKRTIALSYCKGRYLTKGAAQFRQYVIEYFYKLNP